MPKPPQAPQHRDDDLTWMPQRPIESYFQSSSQSSRRISWIHVVVVVVTLLCMVSVGAIIELRSQNTRNKLQVAALKDRVVFLHRRLSSLNAMELTENASVNVGDAVDQGGIRPTAAGPPSTFKQVAYFGEEFPRRGPPSDGQVEVTLQNATFTVHVSWTADGDETRFEVAGRMNRQLSAGRQVVIKVSPDSNFDFTGDRWIQPITVVHNDRLLGTALASVALPSIQDGDRITIHFGMPVAPWNATMVRIKDTWTLLTIERPNPYHDRETIASVDQDKLPNTMLHWARDGDEYLARELARHFIAQRSNAGAVFRGDRDTSLTVPTDANKIVTEPLQSITEDELVLELTRALRLMRKAIGPEGATFEQRIQVANEILQTFGSE